MRLWQLFLIAGLCWLPAAVWSPPTRQQELRVLISARNMLESGNFHRPEFQNRPRFRKPPMAYWLAAGGMAITGETHRAWAGRLFFVAAAMTALWLLHRIAGPAGSHTALLALFSFGFWRYAPLAETDMIQLMGILLFFYAWQHQQGLLAGLGISFACLSKGPGGFIIPFLSLLLLLNFYRPNRKFMLTTLLTPLVLIGGWMLYLAGESSGLEQLQKDLNATFLQSAHRNPWYYYFYTLPLVLLPAGLFGFLKPGKKEQQSPLEQRTALVWFLVTLVLLMLTVSKQRHYALLLMPPALWLLGMRIQSRKLPKAWIFLSLAGLVAAGTLFYEQNRPETRNAAFLDELRPEILQAPTLHVVGINSAIFDFHLGRHVENTDRVQEAIQRAEIGDAIVVIEKKTRLAAEDIPDLVPDWQDSDADWFRAAYLKKNPGQPLTDLN